MSYGNDYSAQEIARLVKPGYIVELYAWIDLPGTVARVIAVKNGVPQYMEMGNSARGYISIGTKIRFRMVGIPHQEDTISAAR